ncbi:poly-gamma-glutamate hydrolase family protein [Streptomyces fuscigenes]|uniref:poly-gamma-glutamate hydrolase family protein n=1 Tax=Streptomyces fuscigenes TaxID=1528880 RepID=UPI001F16018C|nr:poly-gamma-glutamate hydrolase family protein [Streptomyces fuscigenes]MCF3963920.1 poly-gamma-glutamate hydrolase family protein [Streptomyces fuscigenes]
MKQTAFASVQPHEVVVAGTRFLASFRRRSRIGVLALHGTIEAGTAEMAHAVADRAGASVLSFTQPWRPATHVPSHRMSAADCDAMSSFLSHADFVVSLHGHGRSHNPPSIFLGGVNRTAAGVLGRHMRDLDDQFQVVEDLDEIPRGLRGLHPRNPVNLARHGGVQIELPSTARTQRSDSDAPSPFGAVTRAITQGVAELALLAQG